MIKKYLFICLDPAVLPRRAELRKAFRQLLTDGMNELYYLRGYGLTGLDGENSVTASILRRSRGADVSENTARHPEDLQEITHCSPRKDFRRQPFWISGSLP